MKYATLNRYGSIAALIFLSFVLQAKPNNNTNAFIKSLSFIENKGQITDQYGKQRNDIDYKLDGGNVTMFVGDGQIHYQWYQSNKKEKSKNEKTADDARGGSKTEPAVWNTYRMDVVLLGANKNAEIVKEGLQEDYENYYLPQCPDGVTAHRYSKITYKNIYPNIDWEIEASPNPSQGGGLSAKGCKYNFIVHTGGDYRDIKIQYNGATSIALKDGALVAATPMGSITENIPYTYDAVTHKEIKSNFILNNNILSYNVALPLGSGEGNASAFIIDPVLKWGTYYGGAGTDRLPSIADDTVGNSYLLFSTNSISNIATIGAYQFSYGGSVSGTYGDICIVKFNLSGQLQWATYYGGGGDEEAYSIESDENGNCYVTGATNSTNVMAYNSPFQSTPAQGFFSRFNSAGQLQWGSYFNGVVESVCYDPLGAFYIAGNTSSTTGIATAGAHQTSILPSAVNGFIVKFTTTGSRIWGTYYGATTAQTSYGPLHIVSVDCDGLGNVFIGGFTDAQSGITTSGSYLPTLPVGNVAGFIARFSSGGVRQWGTYYNISITNFYPVYITADGQGNAYGVGTTRNTTGMSTAGAHQTIFGGGIVDGFIVKFNNAGARQWGTYFGGSSQDYLSSVNIHSNGDIYVSGLTSSSTNISTGNGHQANLSGAPDLCFAIFDGNGTQSWGTYYGGSLQEDGLHSAWDDGMHNIASNNRRGKVFICGATYSTNNIANSNGYRQSYSNAGDVFLAQFELGDTQVYIQPPFTDTVLCVGDTLHINYGVTYNFRNGNVFTVQLSNAGGSFASPTFVGTINSSGSGSAKFALPNVPTGTGYRIRIISSLPADTSLDNGINMRLSPYPTTPVATANTPLCAGQTLNLSSSNSSTGVVWSWIGPNSFTAVTQNASIPNVQTNGTGDYIVTANLNGCKRKDTVSVTVNPSPAKPNATSNSPICSGQTLNLFATSTTGGVSWSWAGPGGFNTSAQNPNIPNAQTANAGSYVVTATLGSCSSSDTEVVVINQGPAVNVYPSPNDTICQGGSITLVALPISAGTGPTFQWYKNSNPIGGATNTSYSTTPNNGDVYYCRMTPGTGTSCTGAINSNSITMTVLPVTTPSVSISGPAGAQNPFNLLTFHATGTGGGGSPKYQWLRSGQLVQGATADGWSTQGLYLSQHDTICVILTSSDICAVPKSDTACMVVNILTGVDDVNKNTTIQLYPNPNDGIFTLQANSINDKGASIEISDAVGRVVYQQATTAKKGNIDVRIDIHQLAAGVYILNLHDKTGKRTLRFVISR